MWDNDGAMREGRAVGTTVGIRGVFAAIPQEIWHSAGTSSPLREAGVVKAEVLQEPEEGGWDLAGYGCGQAGSCAGALLCLWVAEGHSALLNAPTSR